MQIEPGCRVVYNTSEAFEPTSDIGTVVERHETRDGCWWVDWDDGRRLWLPEADMSLMTKQDQCELPCDVNAAIKLLKEHGYIVMKQM